MKKTFVLLAAVLMVMSFAGAAFAIHAEIPAETQAIVAKGSTQIYIGGEIRIRGWYYDNLGAVGAAAVSGAPRLSNSKANYDQRVRLNIDAKVSPNVQGYIMLESGTASDVYSWGALNSRSGTLTNLAQAWIQYTGSGLFGFNAGVKAGHMPLKLGNGVFFDNTQYGDDAIVFFMDPTKQLHVGLLTVKASDGSNNDNTDDTDAYVALMTYKVDDKNTVGANYMYVNNSDARLSFQNIGLHANGTLGKIGYAAEVDFQFGDQSAAVEYGGWGVMLKGNYKMDQMNLRGMFAMGSGDRDGNADGKNKEFQTMVGGIVHTAFVYDYRSGTSAANQTLSGTANGAAGHGIANATIYNIGIDLQPTKDMKAYIDGYYLRATKAPAGISKGIGFEVDAGVSYAIAKNLTYAINAGYLKDGGFFRDSIGATAKKGATVVNNVFTLSF